MSYFRENIEKMSGYVPGFQPKELEIVKLNTNENPYPPSPAVIEVLKNLGPEKLRRYPDPLGTEFREAAGAVNGVGPECILCTNGGDELLSLAVRAFCDSTRALAYPVPTYSLYPVLAEIENAKVIELPWDSDYRLPAGLAKTGAKLTIVCNPNAPSGTLIGADELGKLAKDLKGKSVLLIDEAYVDFAPQSCVGLVKEHENVIILRSMSKGYSLAGLRFGYAIAQPQMIEGLCKLKDSYNTDAIANAAATAAIKDQAYHAQTTRKVISERARLTMQLRELGLEVGDSNANFVLARHRAGSAEPVYKELVKRNIYVRYFKLAGLEDKLRISVGTPEQDDKLINALREIL